MRRVNPLAGGTEDAANQSLNLLAEQRVFFLKHRYKLAQERQFIWRCADGGHKLRYFGGAHF